MNVEEIISFLETSKDPNAIWKAYRELSASVTESDLPILMNAIQSPSIGFSVREWLAGPIVRHLDAKALPILMKVLLRNYEEGHENDTLQGLLSELAENNPEEVRTELEK